MSGEHGGKRSGAGRKRGSATRKTRDVANRASEEGVTPLEVMLDNMRWAHEAAKTLAKLIGVEGAQAGAVEALKAVAGYREMAQGAARDAAPYIHPRLATVAHTGGDGGPILIATGVPRADSDRV